MPSGYRSECRSLKSLQKTRCGRSPPEGPAPRSPSGGEAWPPRRAADCAAASFAMYSSSVSISMSSSDSTSGSYSSTSESLPACARAVFHVFRTMFHQDARPLPHVRIVVAFGICDIVLLHRAHLDVVVRLCIRLDPPHPSRCRPAPCQCMFQKARHFKFSETSMAVSTCANFVAPPCPPVMSSSPACNCCKPCVLLASRIQAKLHTGALKEPCQLHLTH